MKIVFFGDSNTWGFDPKDRSRQKERFTRIIQKAHPEWETVEEGLNGRTLGHDDPYSLPRNGSRQIDAVIRSHAPFDVLVVMLGSNDAKRMFNTDIHMLERALHHFLEQAGAPAIWRSSPYQPPKILLVQPPQMRKDMIGESLAVFGRKGIAMMEQSGPVFERAASLYHTELLRTDGEDPVCGGSTDGVHMEKEDHEKLAGLLLEKLEEMAS